MQRNKLAAETYTSTQVGIQTYLSAFDQVYIFDVQPVWTSLKQGWHLTTPTVTWLLTYKTYFQTQDFSESEKNVGTEKHTAQISTSSSLGKIFWRKLTGFLFSSTS